MSALNPKISLLIKLAQIAIAVNTDYDDEVTAWLKRMAELEYVEPNDRAVLSAITYVKGPVDVVYSCGHGETLKFIESTQGYIDFISTGLCRPCWLAQPPKVRIEHIPEGKISTFNLLDAQEEQIQCGVVIHEPSVLSLEDD